MPETPEQRQKPHRCNCRCALMPCRHRRKRHVGPGGACLDCACKGFL